MGPAKDEPDGEVDWDRVKEIVADTLELEPRERPAFIATACAGDERLRREVRSLSGETGGFLGVPATAIFDVAAPALGTKIGLEYTLEKIIGEGGMGRVFEATQEHPARTVALKMLRPDFLAPDAERRFHWEIEALGRLSHAGIAKVYDAGIYRDEAGRSVPWFAMELVEGKPLLDAADEANLDRPARLRLFLRVAEAVGHAHQRGIIHRDLKPDNILVDPAGQPHILDFGIARSSDPMASAVTTAGEIVGTLSYMSPEQFLGEPEKVDARSDVYALGVLLYRLVSGEAPTDLDGLSVPQAALRMTTEDPTPLSARDRSFRGDLETVVHKALDRDADRRYSSVDTLAADVRRVLDVEPISARPPTAIYQLSKFAGRHRGLVAGAALALVCLVGAVIGTSLGFFRAEAARKTAELQRDRAAETNAFLQRIFASAAPRNDGLDAKVIDLIRTASLELGLTLDDIVDGDATGPALLNPVVLSAKSETGLEPGVVASLDQTLGDTYRNLGSLRAAKAHLDRALRYFEATQGPFSDGALSALGTLGEVMVIEGDLDGAEDAVERLREGLRAQGDAAPAWLRIHPIQVEAEIAAARDDFEVHLEKAREAFEAWSEYEYPGLDHVEVARMNLANALVTAGELDEASRLLDEGIGALTQRLGKNHPRIFVQRLSKAQIASSQGHHQAALGTIEELLPAATKAWGESHRDTLALLSHHGTALQGLDRMDEAIAVYRRAERIAVDNYGADSFEARAARNNLGVAHMYAQGFIDAEEIFRLSLASFDDEEREGDPVAVLQLELNLATALTKLDRGQEALPIYESAIGRLLSVAGPGHPQTLIARNNVAMLFLELDRAADAIDLAAENLQMAEQHQPGNRMNLYPLRSNLGRAFMAAGRLTEAEEELSRVQVALKEDPDATARERERMRELMGELYRKMGR